MEVSVSMHTKISVHTCILYYVDNSMNYHIHLLQLIIQYRTYTNILLVRNQYFLPWRSNPKCSCRHKRPDFSTSGMQSTTPITCTFYTEIINASILLTLKLLRNVSLHMHIHKKIINLYFKK